MVHRKTVKPMEIDPKDIPYLKQKKVSKREKQETKTRAFQSKVSSNRGVGKDAISKSSRRRQNRKEKSNLHGGSLSDMLSTLPEVQDLTGTGGDAKVGVFVEKARKEINPHASAKNNTKLAKQEMGNFDKTLNNKEYKKNPFAVLNSHIQSTIQRKPEFEKRHNKQQARSATQMDVS